VFSRNVDGALTESRSRADNAAVVAELYQMISGHQADGVRSHIREHFADDARLTLPAALPYGGTLDGKQVLASVFAASASPGAAVGPVNLVLLSLVADGRFVVAEVQFDWAGGSNAGRQSRAIEKWTFTPDGLVEAVDAYYLDPGAAR